MSFRPLIEVPTHTLRRAVIANAVGTGTYTIGAGTVIQPGATGHTKFVTVATSSNPILGVVVGIEYQNKIVELSSVAAINAATTSAAPGNDNETNGYWKVVYIPSNVQSINYSADTSAALATTTDSTGLVYFNLIAVTTGVTGGATIDESSVTLFGGTAGQLFSYGADPGQPGNTKVVVCHINKAL